MIYTIYQITNLLNGKIYVGKHQTNDINDGYMGSGKYLKHAITKYGVENFKKDILFCFETEQEMNIKEAELVTEDFCYREDTYNICVGGKGGWGYINVNNMQGGKFYSGSPKLIKAQQAMKIHLGDIKAKNEWKSKIAKNLDKRRSEGIYNGFEVNKESQKSATEKARLINTGSIVINNGHKNKKIRKNESIPDGWSKGRIRINNV